ncbi:MAG: tripartite tricarboxylate transporter TctB family protein [Burkholderiales bacterium]|nr:tripartite tricarboxylate transporter TctB family protein [Burkholderiales bacterium]
MAHEQPSSGEEAARPLARNSTADLVVAACLAVIGAIVVIEARRLGADWREDGPGAGYFPFYIGLILVVCSVGIFVQALSARRTDTRTFVDSVQLKRVLSVLGPCVAYVAGIMVLGIYVASAIFIALFMVVLGRYAVLRSAIVGVAVNALFFAMFEVWFKVPLYKGALNPLAFLGY